MKKTVQIEESEARKMYLTTTSPEFKQMLETTFGKNFLLMKVTDRIKTYEDACLELGEQPMDEKNLKELGLTNDEITYRKINLVSYTTYYWCFTSKHFSCNSFFIKRP